MVLSEALDRFVRQDLLKGAAGGYVRGGRGATALPGFATASYVCAFGVIVLRICSFRQIRGDKYVLRQGGK